MKNWFLSLAVIFLTTMTYAQGIVTGTVIDGELNTPLPGASIVVKGTAKGTSADMDGKFSLKVESNAGTLEVSYVGFVTQRVSYNLSAGKANVRITLQPDSQALGEVVVTGSSLLDIAQERKTPVAVSTIKAAEIVERLGTKEFPEILNRTPSVYATKGGGGFGDSKINIRGFANENIAVMVNGMPVNDMENGKVYWSNWAGISDVTSAMQVQRGLGASKLAIASVGGTINVVTRSSEMTQGGTISGNIGNDGYHKTLVSYNTGKGQSGWSSSVLLSRTAGEGYVDGTKFEGYNYFFALGYAPNERHGLQFMITGAPQWHNQRSYSIKISDAIKYGSEGEPNRRYSSDWGYLNGEEYSIRRNAYHKPVMMLNWDWNMSEKSSLNTVVYASFGRGFGTGDTGRVAGKPLSSFRNQDNGLYDFDAIVAENQKSTSGALVRRASVNSHDWYGVLSNFNHKFSDEWSLNVGVDGRYYYGYHYQVVSDFLGAKSYTNNANKNLSAPNVVTHSISDKPNYNPFGGSVDAIENRITYSNDGEVRWLGAFGQLEYTTEELSAFVQGSVSNQGFQRIDEFLKPGTLARGTTTPMERKTGFENILGYNIKAGANYNINESHNVFFNTGYYSKQPFFSSVYRGHMNYLSPNNTNEKILGLEAGYGFKSSKVNANVNLYRTTWNDRYLRRTNLSERIGSTNNRYYAEISGLDEVHQGVEVDVNYKVNDYLALKGMFSYGDWFYKGNATALTFDENNQPYTIAGASSNELTLLLEKAKVGDAAQMTANLGATITPFERLNVSLDWRYVNNLYANIDFYAFSKPTEAAKGTLKLPSYNLFDLHLSYKLPLVNKQAISFTFNVDNLFDTYYIAESFTNIHATESSKTYKGVDVSNQVFFGFGRTWNFGLRYTF